MLCIPLNRIAKLYFLKVSVVMFLYVTWPALRNTRLSSLTHSNSMTSTAFAFKSPLYGRAHLLLTGPYVPIYFKLESDISQSDCLCPHPLRFCLLRVIALQYFILSVHNAWYGEKSANYHFWRGVCFDSFLFIHRTKNDLKVHASLSQYFIRRKKREQSMTAELIQLVLPKLRVHLFFLQAHAKCIPIISSSYHLLVYMDCVFSLLTLSLLYVCICMYIH